MHIGTEPKPKNYLTEHRLFHLHYGTGDGGGQWELAHPFRTPDGSTHRPKEIGSALISFQIDSESQEQLDLATSQPPIRLETTWEINTNHTRHTRLRCESNGNKSLNVSAQLAAALMLPETSSEGNAEPVASNVDRFHANRYWFDLLPLEVLEFSASSCLFSIRTATVACMVSNIGKQAFDFDLSGRLSDVRRLCSANVSELMKSNGLRISRGAEAQIREAFAYYKRVYAGETTFDYPTGKKYLSDIEGVLLENLDGYAPGDDVVASLCHQIGKASLTEEECHTLGYRRKVRNDEAASPNEATTYLEGAIRTAISIHKEQARSKTARNECLRLRGTTCAICGFNSEEAYGIPGIIQVHHLKPLSSGDEPTHTDPATDLIPLCPNCHTAIHSKKGDVYSPDELRALIRIRLAQGDTADN